jgi:heat shock protein HslJ
MKTINLLVYMIVLVLVHGCATDANTPMELSTDLASIAGTEWVLTGYQDARLPEALRGRATLKISAEPVDGAYDITGKAFINGYFGKFRIDENKGLIDPVGGVAATKMGGSQEDMSAEMFFLENLGKVTSFGVNENNQLILKFGNNGEIGYFSKK